MIAAGICDQNKSPLIAAVRGASPPHASNQSSPHHQTKNWINQRAKQFGITHIYIFEWMNFSAGARKYPNCWVIDGLRLWHKFSHYPRARAFNIKKAHVRHLSRTDRNKALTSGLRSNGRDKRGVRVQTRALIKNTQHRDLIGSGAHSLGGVCLGFLKSRTNKLSPTFRITGFTKSSAPR